MIPANIREAMQRMNGDEWTGNDAVVVAQFAVPVLERLLQTIEARKKEVEYQIAASKSCVNGSMARAHVDLADRLEDEVYTLQIVLNGAQ